MAKDPWITPWVTAGGGIFCPNHFAMKDARAAAMAKDQAWFDKTGCVFAADGLKVVLIDVPMLGTGYQRYSSPDLLWKGRIFAPSGDDVDPYFEFDHVGTYAFATIPDVRPGITPSSPPFVLSGDTPVTFKTKSDAENWFTKNIFDSLKGHIPHEVISIAGGYRLMLGPAAWDWPHFACPFVRSPSCRIIGKLPG